MASKNLSNRLWRRSNHDANPEFWQQLAQDFPFNGVDEEQLRQHTEQWITYANELLGAPPLRTKRRARTK